MCFPSKIDWPIWSTTVTIIIKNIHPLSWQAAKTCFWFGMANHWMTTASWPTTTWPSTATTQSVVHLPPFSVTNGNEEDALQYPFPFSWWLLLAFSGVLWLVEHHWCLFHCFYPCFWCCRFAACKQSKWRICRRIEYSITPRRQRLEYYTNRWVRHHYMHSCLGEEQWYNLLRDAGKVVSNAFYLRLL